MTESDQLKSIIDILGSPNEEDKCFITDKSAIKYLKDFGDGKRRIDFKARFPYASNEALDLMTKMLEFNPYMRPTIEECINHPFFDKIRNPNAFQVSPRVIDILIDHED